MASTPIVILLWSGGKPFNIQFAQHDWLKWTQAMGTEKGSGGPCFARQYPFNSRVVGRSRGKGLGQKGGWIGYSHSYLLNGRKYINN